MQLDWSSALLFSGLLNAGIGVVFLIRNKYRDQHQQIHWPILILLCFSLILFERIARFSGWIEHYPELLFISSPILFFILPLIYCFQQSLIRLPKRWYLHFILPLIMLLILFPTLQMSGAEKWEMYQTKGIKDPIWIILFYSLFAGYYIMAIFRLNINYAHLLLNAFADSHTTYQLFANRMSLLLGILTLAIPLSFLFPYTNLSLASQQLGTKILFILFSFAGHGILLSFLKIQDHGYQIEPPNQALKKTEQVLANDEEMKHVLTTYMRANKPYLNKDLNLLSLAKEIGWNRTHLSEVINKGFHKNFYDYVNGYRVEEVKLQLEKAKHESYTLEHITAECGFKNYVSFYRFFKRMYGKTPSAYLKSLK